MKAPLIDFLTQYAERRPARFHVPGHKGAAFFRANGFGPAGMGNGTASAPAGRSAASSALAGRSTTADTACASGAGFGDVFGALPDLDLTELPGSDNLFDPQGPIRDIAERYAKFYQVEKTHLLVNGATVGVLASIVSQVPSGRALLVPRASHRSVYGGLRLAGARPVFLRQGVQSEFPIPAPVTKEQVGRALKEHPEIAAVFVTSPDYYGTVSDLKGIAEVAHAHDCALIVDQAHGAHLILTAPELSAERVGADLIINSTHKTLASFTQSAILNVQGSLADREALTEALEILESSSPSYLLMASLEANIAILEEHAEALAQSWLSDVRWFRETTKPMLDLSVYPGDARPVGAGYDETKLALRFGKGIPASRAEALLRARGVWVEMAAGEVLLLETGIGNVRADYERLVEVLKEVVPILRAEYPDAVWEETVFSRTEASLRTEARSQTEASLRTKARSQTEASLRTEAYRIPEYVGIPNRRERIPLEEAEGRIAAAMLIPYPPGIPVVCPGERISKKEIVVLTDCRRRNEQVLGIDEEGTIAVGKE